MKKTGTNRIISFIECISVQEFKRTAPLYSDCFDKKELKYLKKRSIQTRAAFYLLKNAVRKCIKKIFPDINISEKQIILGHKENGAPEIVVLPVKIKKLANSLKISISHTKEFIYSFAAFSENENE